MAASQSSVNSTRLVARLRGWSAAAEIEVGAELEQFAHEIAAWMRVHVAKFRSLLTNAISATKKSPFWWEIGPLGVDYAEAVEKGVPAGGKGLPRFFDPASASIVAWLEKQPRSGFVGPANRWAKPKRKPRVGSKGMQAAMLALRDRYEGLAWHIRHFGVKAQPYVAPAREQFRPLLGPRVAAALARVNTGAA